MLVLNGVVSGQYIRSAGSFAYANDFDGANGGELLTEDTTGGLPTGLTRMEIGRGWSKRSAIGRNILDFSSIIIRNFQTLNFRVSPSNK